MEIRPERPEEAPLIRRVNESAFGQPDEADIVDRLRGSPHWIDELSLVAVDSGELVGHLLLSTVTLDAGIDVLALAPMAVVPQRQRQGVGSALVREALARAATTKFPLIIVVGHPEYYPRFGFEAAAERGVSAPFPVPDQAWMLYRLPRYDSAIRGRVVYPPAFGL
ncbi:MAG: N-acetyltransferase [Actinomycetota bacterium]|nr:N-acetyltransferase [Actinomycetota bacterium]